MAGGAFDTTKIKAEHNPLISGLTQQFAQDANELAVIAEQFAQTVLKIVKQGIVDVVKSIGGVNLSSVEALLSSLLSLGGGFVAPFLSELEAVGGLPVSLVTGLADELLVGPQSIIDSLVNVLGGGSGSGNAATGVATFLKDPLTLLADLPQGVEAINQDLQSLFAKLDGRVTVLENQQAGGTPVGIYDPCSNVSGFTTVGSTNLASDGFSIRNTSTATGYHTVGPATDTHGLKFSLSRKMPGICRGIITADTGLTNYAALEIRADGTGNDYARIVVGFGPNTVIAQNHPDGTPAQWDGRISQSWTWELDYDLPSNTYTGYLNGVAQDELIWVDATNQVSHGSGQREVAWCTNAGNSASSPGFAVTSINIYDKTPT